MPRVETMTWRRHAWQDVVCAGEGGRSSAEKGIVLDRGATEPGEVWPRRRASRAVPAQRGDRSSVTQGVRGLLGVAVPQALGEKDTRRSGKGKTATSLGLASSDERG